MIQIFKYLLVAAVSLTIPVSNASVVMPGDGPYYRYRQGPNLYIYSDDSAPLVDQLMAYTQAIQKLHDTSFGWKLDAEADLILASPAQQIANAYATVVPNLKTVWYPSGQLLLEYMAESSWMLALATHETAHLYQLNAKGSFNSGLKSIFGNSIVLFTPVLIPLFIHPNLFTPTFLLEGNAVMNESRFNLGGRLHSGEARALVLAQIAAGDITPARLINDQFKFPYGETPYLQGAYFQAHLAAKHGVDKTNQFFQAQGEHYIWPLILNKTFRDHYGASYPQEIREYVRGMEALAKQQKKTEGSALLEATYFGPLNHDDQRIWFLMTHDKRPPILTIFSKTDGRISQETLDLPMGKVFWQDGEPQVSTSDQHSLHLMEYSLYGEGAELNPAFRGQIVTDQRAGKTVALNARNGWLDPQLLVNGEVFDVAHSSGILDSKGSVYYFRQNGAQRILYKDREPLFKFDGFYAKPMEVAADGNIYFIGATNFGSTLYQYNGKEVTRVLDSDRVTDARMISANEFLVTEVENTGHRVLKAKAQRKSQLPAVYSYGFPSTSLVPDTLTSKDQIQKGQRDYNSFSQIRYSSLDFGYGWSDHEGHSILLSPLFTDPMEYQALSLTFFNSEKQDQTFQAVYSFTKFLPDFFLSYYYSRENWEGFQANGNRFFLKSYDQQAALGMALPFLRHKRWDGQATVAAVYENEDLHASGSYKETYGSYSTLALRYQIAPPLGFYPWREFNLNYHNRLNTLASNWTKDDNTSLVHASQTFGFPLEFYANFSANYAWAENQDIAVEYAPYPMPNSIHIPRLTAIDEADVQQVGSVRLEVRKVFNTPLYSTRIPASFSRVSPVVVAQGIFMDDDPLDRYPQNTFEFGAGADVELLLLHRLRAQLRFLLLAVDTRHPDQNDEQVNLSIKESF